jgi:hypothetical protein
MHEGRRHIEDVRPTMARCLQIKKHLLPAFGNKYGQLKNEHTDDWQQNAR